MNKQCTVALAGNPNSGKTTLFNLLTGSHCSYTENPDCFISRA
ncbi:MAG: FeoB small GTPase domain-containing protein [Leuconostoc mesenteroides]|nr:FeoB small GTPase domain-containing protein [Leuconostoc mesenteroides]